jgi:hypothetical protein
MSHIGGTSTRSLESTLRRGLEGLGFEFTGLLVPSSKRRRDSKKDVVVCWCVDTGA